MAIADLSETRVQNEILSTTADTIHGSIVENALDGHPGVSIFFGKIGAALSGQIGQDGSPSGTAAREATGESIRIRAKLDVNGSAKRLQNGFSEFSVDSSDTVRGLRANWKLYGATAIISGMERRNNRGAAEISDLWTHRHNDAVSALVDLVAQDIFSTNAVSTAITSLDAIIGSTSSLQNASGSTYSKWCSRGLSDKGTDPASVSFTGGSFLATGHTNWRKAALNATEGSIRPNAIVTTDNLYLYYEGSLTPQIRYASDELTGQIGFKRLLFKDAPVFHDPYCPSGYTYFINTDMVYGVYSPGALFNMTPIHEEAYQDAFSVKILFQGQMVCQGRKYNNKITTQTA